MTRDRYGEPIEPDADQVDEHRCDRGWLDRDADRPRPCPTCKPHLFDGLVDEGGGPR